MPGVALAWLAAGLCAGAVPAAPTAEVEVTVEVAARRLEGRARYRLEAGIHDFTWHPATQITTVQLDGAALPEGARGPRGLRFELRTAADLDLAWRLPLAPLDAGIDHRGAMTADRPMAGGGSAWLPGSAGWYPAHAAGLGGYTLAVHTREGTPVSAGAVERPTAAPGIAHPGTTAEPAGTAAEPAGTAVSAAAPHRFRHPYPVSAIDLLIGPYTVERRALGTPSGASLELATYLTPAVADLAGTYLDAAAAQIAEYDALIGPWPFARFAIVASPLPTGFGMPGMTWLGEEVLRLPFIPGTSLRHEVLHNWWGNGVRVDYARGNWSEGLTTLMADYLVKEREGPAAAAAERLGWVRTLLAVPPGEAIALREFRARAHGRQAAVGYGKAAFLLLMLRERIGGAAWQAGLQGFWQACRHREASWDDLRVAFEQAAGQDLTAAFEPWLVARTLPTPRIDRALASADGRELNLHLAQGAPVHDLDLPVQVRTRAGIEMRRVRLATAEAAVTLGLAAPALGVRLDPALEVLRAPPATAIPPILRNALLAARPAWQVAGTAAGTPADTTAWHTATEAVARAFFERPAQRLDGDEDGDRSDGAEARNGAAATPPPDAILLAGPRPALAAAIAALGLGAERPDALDVPADARVWTARAPATEATIVVIEAEDPALLGQLARPLPHYGASGYLAFAGGRAIVRGAAPFSEPEIAVTPGAEAPGG